MKTQQQTTWQFAKLAFAALVSVFGVIACGGGVKDGSDGSRAGINPPPLNAPTAMPDNRKTAGYFEFNVVLKSSIVSTEYANYNLVFRRSNDETIKNSDEEVVTRGYVSSDTAVSCPIRTSCNEITADVFAPSTGYYGVCSKTTGTCSNGVKVTVVGGDFDLSVTTFSVSAAPALVNGEIMLSTTVRNAESAIGYSPEARVNYYRSLDQTIDTDDTYLEFNSISELAVGAAETDIESVDTPSSAGTYYYGACIVATGDINPRNNCSDGVQVDVVARDFDLSVTTFSVGSPIAIAIPGIDVSIYLRATVTNAATATHPSPVEEFPYDTLKYYRSSNATITSSDTEVGTDSISELAVGATSNEERSTVVPSTVGTYYYGACVDAPGDSDTSNDCSTGAEVTVIRF